ncbi:hypothetical protein [Kribbella sp. NPDC055071]
MTARLMIINGGSSSGKTGIVQMLRAGSQTESIDCARSIARYQSSSRS